MSLLPIGLINGESTEKAKASVNLPMKSVASFRFGCAAIQPASVTLRRHVREAFVRTSGPNGAQGMY
jgi:hypothetical protein